MYKAIKSLALRALGEPAVGFLDYYRYPERRRGWGGPFNGQEFRLALFDAIMERAAPVAIVETGTFLGTTTECLAGTGRPVFTVEGNPRNYGFAKARLRNHPNVTLLRGDSRAALRELFEVPLAPLIGETLFFYLDAHWKADLPLAQELEIIFSRCPRAVVMVDDFQVPSDPGYGFDDYGPGRALTPEYILPALAAHSLVALYPSTPAARESGARRGCVVIARADIQGNVLCSIPLLCC